MNKTKICFVGSDNYPVLNPEYGETYIGGESVQQSLLAIEFAKQGYDVSTVVKDNGQPDAEIIHGITIWKTFKEGSGLPVFKFIHPKMTLIWKALKNADADIYYQSCAGVATGVVALFCSLFKRKFVFRIAHDTDCIPGEQLIPYWRDKKIYEYGLRNADLVIAQSKQQQELLKKNYNLDSEVLNMVVELPGKNKLERDIDVLWVNNFRPFKRPEKLPEIARLLPDIKFTMIGGPCHGHEDLFDQVSAAASQLDNLEFCGFVPYHKVNEMYRRSRIFLNTSDSEGFPNSFLQSWVRGTPVISFFDPDNTISRESIGTSPDDLNSMINDIKMLLEKTEKLAELSSASELFAVKHYSPESIVNQYMQLFTDKKFLQ